MVAVPPTDGFIGSPRKRTNSASWDSGYATIHPRRTWWRFDFFLKFENFEKITRFRRCPIETFFRIQAPNISTINPYFTKPCTVKYEYPVDYSHDLLKRTRAYLWNIFTLNLKTGKRKRTFETFFAALTNDGSGDRFVVSMRWLRELKLCIIANWWFLCLIIFA